MIWVEGIHCVCQVLFTFSGAHHADQQGCATCPEKATQQQGFDLRKSILSSPLSNKTAKCCSA